MFDVHQFLFRSDWMLAASGVAYMKLRQNGTVFKEASPVQGCSSNFTVWLSWDVMSLSRLFKYSLLRA